MTAAESGTARAEVVLDDDAAETVAAALDERGWGDGLPVVPPTPERVDAMLAASPGDPDEVIAVLSPRNGRATRRTIAINAVMAGCTAEVLPLLIAVTRVLGGSTVNLPGINATTHPVAPLVIVHGAAVERMGLNAGAGSMGPGNGSNAVIARAVRLLLLHVAGARPGDGDLSTQGSPTKYGFVMAENAAASPWSSYPASIGIDAESAVTVFPAEGPHNIHDMESDTPWGVLDKIASTITTLGHTQGQVKGGEFLIALCPEHAATIAAWKWARGDIQMYLYERSRLPAGRQRTAFQNRNWPRWMKPIDDDEPLPMAVHPDRFRVLVTGGDGKHSAMLPSWGRSETVPLEP